jgi:hypothetical protein
MFPQVSFKRNFTGYKRSNYLSTQYGMERRQVRQKLVSKLLRIGEIFIPQLTNATCMTIPQNIFLVEKKRAFSHGYQNSKPAELANKIMEDDRLNPEKIDEAMHAGKKFTHSKTKFRFI